MYAPPRNEYDGLVDAIATVAELLSTPVSVIDPVTGGYTTVYGGTNREEWGA